MRKYMVELTLIGSLILFLLGTYQLAKFADKVEREVDLKLQYEIVVNGVYMSVDLCSLQNDILMYAVNGAWIGRYCRTTDKCKCNVRRID